MDRFQETTITAVRPEGVGAVAISLNAPFDWTAGQYVTLRAEIGGEDLRRSYSIASLPGEPLTVGIRAVEGGAFSTFAQGLRPGDRMNVMVPAGRFCLKGEKRLLLVAAGSGITPVAALAGQALAEGAEVTLIYGNRNSASIMFKTALEALKDRYLDRFRLIHILSREAQDVALFQGRIDLVKLADSGVLETDFDGAYLCGPGGMIDDGRSALERLGLPAERIYSERFLVAGEAPRARKPAPIPEGARVEAILDGRRQSFALPGGDMSVVEAAAQAGLDLPYSCKGGMCCTCRCKIVEGQAEMAVNYSLEPWEIEAGFTLACQARPRSEKLILDFDAA